MVIHSKMYATGAATATAERLNDANDDFSFHTFSTTTTIIHFSYSLWWYIFYISVLTERRKNKMDGKRYSRNEKLSLIHVRRQQQLRQWLQTKKTTTTTTTNNARIYIVTTILIFFFSVVRLRSTATYIRFSRYVV